MNCHVLLLLLLIVTGSGCRQEPDVSGEAIATPSTVQSTPASSATPHGPFRTTNSAEISIQLDSDGFTVVCLNNGTESVAVVPPSTDWRPEWEIAVTDANGLRHGLSVPPAAAIPITPDRFKVLKPGISVSASYRYSSFSGVDRSTDTLVALKEPAEIEAAYVFQPDEVTQKLQALEMHPATPAQNEADTSTPLEAEKQAWQELFQTAPLLLPTSANIKL